jgi:cell division protein FtsB
MYKCALSVLLNKKNNCRNYVLLSLLQVLLSLFSYLGTLEAENALRRSRLAAELAASRAAT